MLRKCKWRPVSVVLAQKVNEVRVRSETTMLFMEEEALYARGATIMTPLRSHYQAY